MIEEDISAIKYFWSNGVDLGNWHLWYQVKTGKNLPPALAKAYDDFRVAEEILSSVIANLRADEETEEENKEYECSCMVIHASLSCPVYIKEMKLSTEEESYLNYME